MKTPSHCSGCHEEVVQGAMSGQNGSGRGLGAVIKVRVIPEEVPGQDRVTVQVGEINWGTDENQEEEG